MQERTFEEYKIIIQDILSSHEIYCGYSRTLDFRYEYLIRDYNNCDYIEIVHGGTRLHWSRVEDSILEMGSMKNERIEMRAVGIDKVALCLAHIVNNKKNCSYCSIKTRRKRFKSERL